jgi:high-affinity iron transporter
MKVAMFANLLIGLREGLEASLIVGILVAYVVQVDRRDVIGRIWAGVAAALVVSIALGFALTLFADAMGPAAEPIIAGVASIAAAAMITWMIFWMAKTARSIKGELESEVASKLSQGAWAVVGIAFLAVVREGAETTLFVWAAAQNSSGTLRPLIGAVLGILISATIGYLIYRGSLRFNLSKFFLWSGVFLIIIAASMLVGGVGDLQQEAGLLPFLTGTAYDFSGVIPEDSILFIVLRGVFGFHNTMTWLQLIVWALFIAITMTTFLRKSIRRKITPVETTEIRIIRSVN